MLFPPSWDDELMGDSERERKKKEKERERRKRKKKKTAQSAQSSCDFLLFCLYAFFTDEKNNRLRIYEESEKGTKEKRNVNRKERKRKRKKLRNREKERERKDEKTFEQSFVENVSLSFPLCFLSFSLSSFSIHSFASSKRRGGKEERKRKKKEIRERKTSET